LHLSTFRHFSSPVWGGDAFGLHTPPPLHGGTLSRVVKLDPRPNFPSYMGGLCIYKYSVEITKLLTSLYFIIKHSRVGLYISFRRGPSLRRESGVLSFLEGSERAFGGNPWLLSAVAKGPFPVSVSLDLLAMPERNRGGVPPEPETGTNMSRTF
jgi:hypothetical protein